MAEILTQDWSLVQEELRKGEERRDAAGQQAREVKHLARRAVFALHKQELEAADQLLQSAESAIKEKLLPLLKDQPTLRQLIFGGCMEEVTSALALKIFLTAKRLLRPSEVPFVETEEYLGGVLDFTQELIRYAIQQATVRNVEAVQNCRDLVEALMTEYLKFNFRNSLLRRKFDGLKYTLKKLENTLYELSLVTGTAAEPTSAGSDEEHSAKRARVAAS